MVVYNISDMSGHSHYATIKRKKEATDAARGKIISKHAKAVQVAIKTGGSADPETNAKLRFAIDQAKAMPESSKDATFLTDARLLSFVNKIETYLGLPLSTEL